MMNKYEILEHTGDAKIRAFGKNKQELFLNAMLGMRAILKPRITNHVSRFTKRLIKVSSVDIHALLADFLSEVNYLAQTKGEAYNKVKFLRFSDTEIVVELSGQKVEEFGEEIKAVTYHGLEVKQNSEGRWEATLIFDI